MAPEIRDEQPKPVRQVSSQELLGLERILRIEHNGEIYTLRLTRNDRLILTK
jgi:hemin uptake protein HemP